MCLGTIPECHVDQVMPKNMITRSPAMRRSALPAFFCDGSLKALTPSARASVPVRAVHEAMNARARRNGPIKCMGSPSWGGRLGVIGGVVIPVKKDLPIRARIRMIKP